jgi:anti-anti-sigma factor
VNLETGIPPVAEVEFAARSDLAEHGDEKVLTIHLEGTADFNTKPHFDRFMRSLHEQALRLAVREVVVDLGRLAFMNSSCFKVVVAWILSVGSERHDAKYRITFVENPALYWQRHSLKALTALAPDRISVQGLR